MNWFFTALLSSAMQGGVNIIDSHLLSRRMLGLRTFMLAMGIVQLLYILTLYLLFPWPERIPTGILLSVIGATIAGTSSALLTMYVLQKEEVSRVTAILRISPIFVAIIATTFLGENLDYRQWLAIFIAVAGAMIISAEQNTDHTGATASRAKPFLLLFLASLLAALGSIFAKHALSTLSFWNMYSMSLLGTSIIMLSFSVRPESIRQWMSMERRNSTLALVVVNEVAALSASVLFVRAISLGPVSLVSVVMGTRPVLVMVFSLILSLVLPGFLLKLPNRRILLIRFAAIAMIVGGVSVISLT